MPDPKPVAPNTKAYADLYQKVRVKTIAEGWSIAGLIREAFALYLNGEITKPEETNNDGK